MECFFGRLKRVFGILNDHCFRLSWDKLEDVVTFCVSLMNFRHRHRGHALTRPLIGATRYVPVAIPASRLPPGSAVRALGSPPVHKPDARIRLTPSRAHLIMERKAPAEIQDMLEELLAEHNVVAASEEEAEAE